MVLSTQIARIDGMYLAKMFIGLSCTKYMVGLMLAASIDDEQVHHYLGPLS